MSSTGDRHLILLVEESDNSLGFYDSETGKESGRINLSLWPHEVTVSADGRTAYVSNFGLRDYDLTLGYAGNSISVIDVPSRCEVHRLYTTTKGFEYWAPHGVKLSPDGTRLYVNVERVVGLRSVDPTAGPGQEQTRILVYDVESRQLIHSFDLPAIDLNERAFAVDRSFRLQGEPFGEQAVQSYGVPRGSHNFLFSPDGALWIFSGPNGISKIDPISGAIQWQCHPRDFIGSVRGLALMHNGNLVVSATNQVSILNTKNLRIEKQIGDLGVGQILYSQVTPDDKHILSPAVWEGQVLIINIATGSVVKRLLTGVDPVHIVVPPNSNSAYVTHGRSHWAAEIDLQSFEVKRRIQTRGGPNGVDLAKWFPEPKRRTLTLGAVLPFTGEFSPQGREIRLGYDLWKDRVNASGGILINGDPTLIDIAYEDSESATDPQLLFEKIAELIGRLGIRTMFGGYPAATNRGIANAAREHDAILLTFTGDDSGLYRQGNRNIFGIMTSSEEAAKELFNVLWRRLSPKPTSATIVVADDSDSLRRANEIEEVIRQRGVNLIVPDSARTGDGSVHVIYSSADEITEQLVRQVRETKPDLLIHVGERMAAIKLVGLVRQLRFTPGLLVSTCGITASSFRTELGQLSDRVVGPVQWSACMENYGEDRFVTAQDYVRTYFAEHSEVPSYLAAGASACGVVFETAMRQLKTFELSKLREELLKIERPTFFGQVAFAQNGLNNAKSILTVQLTGGKPGEEEIIGPDEFTSKGSLRWLFGET